MKLTESKTFNGHPWSLLAVILVVAVTGVLTLANGKNAQAQPTKTTTCITNGCHIQATEASANLVWGIKVASPASSNASNPSSITVDAGSSFELDVIANYVTWAAGGNSGMSFVVSVPSGWTIGSGTTTGAAPAGWKSVWDQADGVGWRTGTVISMASNWANAPDGYDIDYTGSSWQGATTSVAEDRGSAQANDRDTVADQMGTDVTISVPGGTTPGSYEIHITGIGHNASKKAYLDQLITVTVSGGAPTTPTLTSPTATSVLSTTATLGANVTSDGGAALTARGTVWGTTAAPTGNQVAEGGTATGAFTQARTGLTAGTKIYYRGYATNSAGTGYSPDGSFYTEPATQASGVNFTSVGSGGMTVNWTRGSGDGVIVLMKSGSAVNSDPVDGTYTGYTANAAFGSGTQIGTGNYVLYRGTGTSVAVTGLSGSTTYHVAVYEYKGTVDTAGVDQGVNYKATAATGNQATSAGASPPTLTSPTATAIDTTTATLGANVTGDGGAAITARGTVWGTTAAPTGNQVAEGGTATGVFTMARTGLTAGTKIYYRGYATNSAGTAYSPDGSFYTEPATQATAVNFTGVNANDMTVNWTRGSGNEVIVLMHEGAAVDSDPVDGTYTGYTANAAFGSGTQIGSGNYVVYKGSGTSVTVTGLTASTTYHVKVYEVAGNVDTAGVDQGANYQQTTPATASQATGAAANAPPTVTGSLQQYQSNGITVLASGGTSTNSTVVVEAQVNDTDGDLVMIEVDIDSNASVDCVSAAVSGSGTPKATCTGLADGAYNWQVRAKDDQGNTSGWSAFSGTPDFNITQGVDIGIDTTAPTESGFALTPGDTVIDLSWNLADDGSGSGLDPVNTYKVVRQTGSSPADCSAAGIYTGNLTAYHDTGLSNGTTYYYRVCAYDKVGNVSTGQTSSAAPGSACTYNAPSVSILGANKEITNDGGFVDYTISVTNNDTGACPAVNFDIVVTDSNSTAFYATSIATDPLNVAMSATQQTTIRVRAKASQNSTTNNTYFSTVADGNHAASANSNSMTTTINVSGGGCISQGSYLSANGDQIITSR